MRAPTSISSLVHSSTLVTAGVLLITKFSVVSALLLSLRLSTLLVSRLLALCERDLKKVVALSTMRQMSLLGVVGAVELSSLFYFHLIRHALFKSLMFLRLGNLLHSSSSSQHKRLVSSQEFLSVSVLSLRVLSLIGQGYLVGFYSKDLIIEALELRSGVSCSLFVGLVLFLTLCYGSKLLSPCVVVYKRFGGVQLSVLLLLVLVVFRGVWLYQRVVLVSSYSLKLVGGYYLLGLSLVLCLVAFLPNV